MIKRTLDPTFISAVIQHAEVAKWVGGTVDVEAVVKNPLNYCLVTEHGGFIFHRYEACIYETHTTFLPNTPPAHAYHAAIAARKWMFTHTDVYEAYTKVAEDNRRAKRLTEAMNWRLRFKGGVWPTEKGPVQLYHYVMHYEDWVLNDPDLAKRGAEFHARLVDAGVELDHPPDEVHDRYVGATIETVLAGQWGKALCFYNRWALSAGYLPIKAINQSPLIIDIHTCKLHVRDNDFEVLLCQ